MVSRLSISQEVKDKETWRMAKFGSRVELSLLRFPKFSFQLQMQELLPHARARLEVMEEVERGAAIERARSLAQV